MNRQFQQRAKQEIPGFRPSANPYTHGRLPVTEVLTIDPESPFYFQMDSQAMKNHGIMSGDILLINQSLIPVKNALVIAYVNRCYFCRQYDIQYNRPVLRGDEDEMTTGLQNFNIVGVVTSICRNFFPHSLRYGQYRRVCTL